jgi:hypothetical protein
MLDRRMKKKFKDRFPKDIPHVNELPTDVYHHIELKSEAAVKMARTYTCPCKYRVAWKTLIKQHHAAGCIRPSSSEFASPSFIIPKADRTILLHWVNNYWALNSMTILDHYPLPRVDNILADCAKGKIWGIIDVMNSFFQTLVKLEHIKYTATLTPYGLWEWVIMPMGLHNSPATHQRRVALALKKYIRRICHVYLDDIIIWSNLVEEHERNIELILDMLRAAGLFCSLKKSTLFASKVNFLGHHILQRGIEADRSKVEQILNWPAPKNAKEVRCFLGLVHYLATFLPNLVKHMVILTPVTKKECNMNFPIWSAEHQYTFNTIKKLVRSHDCLTTINHENPRNNKIFITCNVSKHCTGAVLSFGPSWEMARPCAFESRALKEAKLHYPVHEQDMLAIIRALHKWRVDLLGSQVFIYTDHKTLENFKVQKELSCHQARWMEYTLQYEYSIKYINGERNTMADALSRLPELVDAKETTLMGRIFEIKSDEAIIKGIREGYQADPWCTAILEDLKAGMIDEKLGIMLTDGLLFIGKHLVIPSAGET